MEHPQRNDTPARSSESHYFAFNTMLLMVTATAKLIANFFFLVGCV